MAIPPDPRPWCPLCPESNAKESRLGFRLFFKRVMRRRGQGAVRHGCTLFLQNMKKHEFHALAISGVFMRDVVTPFAFQSQKAKA